MLAGISDKERQTTYQHVNGQLSIDMVHVHITATRLAQQTGWHMGHFLQFIKTANGRAHGFPKGQQQTYLREGFLTTGERSGASAGTVILGDIRLDLEAELAE